METAEYFPVGAAPEQLEQGEAWWCVWACRAVSVILILLAFPIGFAGLVYLACHSRHDIALVITTPGYLVGLLLLLHRGFRNLGLVPSLNDPEWRPLVRRVMRIAYMVTITMSALLVADETTNPALKLAVRGLTVVGTAVLCYFILSCRDGESGDAGLGHGRPDAAADELTPEENV